MSFMNDDALLQEFVAESREHLSSIEPDLLILERDEKNTDPEIINRIFRAIHSIKGASGFFGLESLKCLSHGMENTLMLLRDGKLVPSADVMDPLLIGVDRLRLMLEDIQSSEQVTYQDVVDALQQLIGGGKEAPCETEPLIVETAHPAQAFLFENLDRNHIEKSIRNGQKLYHIQILMDRDLYQKDRTILAFQDLLASTGGILSSTLEIDEISGLENCLEASLSWQLLYGTVLDSDLLGASFDLSEDQFKEVSLASLFPDDKSEFPNDKSEPIMPTQLAAVLEEKPQDKALTVTASEPVKEKLPAKTGTSAQNSESNETIRVKVDLLNRLMDLAGELVLARNQLTRIFETQANKTNDMSNIIQNVDLVTSDLQEHIMQTRMQAISSVFGKFPRLVRDLSRQLNKEINLEMSGEEVELDKSILESLSDPLTHLIRNCCDHGMEKPEVRESAGKSRQGTILLKAYQESGHINIVVIDDGAGIDHERIARKALESGVITETALRQMSPKEQVNLIFMPGFSTADAVTDVSGRGVGMDVVRTNIEQIGGSISIETEKGKGTSISLRLPLTLAIIPSLVVNTAGQIFAVPQINLVELVCVNASQIAERIEKIGTASVLRLRGKLLPLIRLSHVLGLQDEYLDVDSAQRLPDKRSKIHDERQYSEPQNIEKSEKTFTAPERRSHPQSDYHILVLQAGNRHYGLIVDEIRDIEEIVVKPLSSFLKNCKCFSGATIMGDGQVAMILDVAGIIAISNLSFSEANGEEQKRKQMTGKDQKSLIEAKSQSILLFTNATDEIFAMPLASILRLEKIKVSSIEKVGNQKFLPYQGKSMSLLFLNDYLPVPAFSENLEDAYLIIPIEGECTIGIVVSSILDTIEFASQLEPSLVNNISISGSAVINNHVTLFINPEGLLESSGYRTQLKRNMEWQAAHLQPSS